ncbi:MAG TPA: DUF952 domain-containing protein [Anaerolineae bacterium]|nr:DUF952 domain-containing protein [Anaerolineae bacterium]
MRSANIFHIAHSADWRKALDMGIYSADTLGREGFIHCCFWDQVKKVGSQFFKNVEDLVLVEIDVSKLSSKVKEENLEGGQELFPHVYGAINLEAVVAVREFIPEDS